MMLALAVAMGCDLFDSAAYALYARDGRYLTVRGTEHLAELEYFPCACPVCARHTPAELRGLDDEERERLLAEHNLHVTFEEMREIKQAIRAGNLLELVEARARGHPAMVDGYRALLDHADQLERSDPASKGTFFHLSADSARRPEVCRHRRRLARLSPRGEVLLTETGAPADHGYDEVWSVTPPFGPVPPALRETYPFTAETPERLDDAAYVAAAEAVAALADAHPGVSFTLAAVDWPADALATLPDGVAVETLREDGWRPVPGTGADGAAEGRGTARDGEADGAGTDDTSVADADDAPDR
jgi:7-cyano-7-deazaguanine tRNA-ribosyltransferase